jgi:radical SAM protein with 4Fe4S-binding SPASM domain
MRLRKDKNTSIRYERYGGFVYLLNKKNQNKTKITSRNEAFLFWLASRGKPVKASQKIREWIKKGYLEKLNGEKKESLLTENQEKSLFDQELSQKPRTYTSNLLLATIEITAKCNYHCQHCGNDSGKEKKNELGLKEIKKIITEMERLGVLKLTLTGGEPLLRKDFFKILKFAIRKIPRVSISSNGSLIDKKMSRKLKIAGVTNLKISLDGTELFHDQFRGHQGAYQKAIRAIKHLLKQGIEIRVQSTLMKDNLKEILSLMPIMAKLGVKIHVIVPCSPIGRASKEMILKPEEYQRFVLKVNKKAKELKAKTIFEIRPVFGLNYKNKLEVLSTKYKCEALKTTLEITADGRIIPCSFFPLTIGHVRKTSLERVWHSPKANQVRKIFNENLLKGKCRDCDYRKDCGGGCLANSYALLKRFHFGDIYCWR